MSGKIATRQILLKIVDDETKLVREYKHIYPLAGFNS